MIPDPTAWSLGWVARTFAALLLTAALALTGTAWAWLMPSVLFAPASRVARALRVMAAALAIGSGLFLPLTMLWFEFGLGTRGIVLCWGAVWCGAGVFLGWLFARERVRAVWSDGWPGLVLLWAATWIVLSLPGRSAWVVGGWDPGVYVNQGVAAARAGAFHVPALPVHAFLPYAEMRPFLRDFFGRYIECFPGMPIDPASRVMQPYFFRLFPTWIALAAQAGGLTAATRVNLVLGLPVLLLVGAMLRTHGYGRAQAVMAVSLLAFHPLWVYHLQLPVSEMLELVLWCAAAWMARWRRDGAFPAFLVGMVLLAGLLNRFSFLPFAAMLVAVMAWEDGSREDRGAVLRERFWQMLGLAAGVWFDYVVCRITMVRLTAVAPRVVGFAALILVAATCFDLCAFSARFRRCVERLSPWKAAALAAGPLLLFGLVVLSRLPAWARMSAGQMARQMPFLVGFAPGGFASPLLVLAVPAGMWLLASEQRPSRFLAGMAVALVGVALASSMGGHIVAIQPWSSRRYLTSAVPLLAMLTALPLGGLWAYPGLRRSWRRVGALLLLAAVLGGLAPRAWRAWSRPEYDNVAPALAAIARQVNPQTDVVLADHHWWGAPLLFLYDRQVLNGTWLYEARGPGSMARALKALERFRRAGWRVRFLTSTEHGLDLYPIHPGTVSLDWEAPPLRYRELVHGPAVTDFVWREKAAHFRLYTWQDGAPTP